MRKTNYPRTTQPRKRPRRPRRIGPLRDAISAVHFHIEPLERRTLLTLVGVPTWVEEGPGPITGNSNTITTPNEVSGAVTSIAADGATTLYVGTSGGGIWKTDNANVSSPTWRPLTDQFPSLAITDIAIDPTDHDIIWAGTGRASNSEMGGKTIGLMKSIDGGDHWKIFDASLGSRGRTVNAIVPTQVPQNAKDGTPGHVILIASEATAFGNGPNQLGGGLLRSKDGGANGSFEKISGNANDGLDNDGDHQIDEADENTGLPGGDVTDLKGDPNNINFFYAAVAGQGVFFSRDAGRSWTAVNTGLTNIPDSVRIRLAVSATKDSGTGQSPVYAALITPISEKLLAAASGNTIQVPGDAPFEVGDVIDIDPGTALTEVAPPPTPRLKITRIQRTAGVATITLNRALLNPHAANAPVAVSSKFSETTAPTTNGASQIVVDAVGRFARGDVITITDSAGTDSDTRTIVRVIHSGGSNSTLVLSAPLSHGYSTGSFVLAPSVSSLRLRQVYRSANLSSPPPTPSWTPMQLPGSTDQINFDANGDGTIQNNPSEIVQQTFGINLGGQGALNFSFVADPSDANVIFVGGDTQPDLPDPADLNSNGTTNDINVFPGINEIYNSAGDVGFIGRIFRGDASVSAPGVQWQQRVGNSVNGTSPHADSRTMIFANGALLESDDGGIYRFDAGTNAWKPLNGNLGLSELYSVAYDPSTNLILAGAQDVGTSIQSAAPPASGSKTFNNLVGGDGTVVQVGLVSGGTNRLFYSTPQLGNFRMWIGGVVSSLPLTVSGALSSTGAPMTLKQYGFPQFVQPYAVNAVPAASSAAPTGLLFGTEWLFESTAGFGTGSQVTLLGVRGGAANPAPGSRPSNAAQIGTVNALIYGGVEPIVGARPNLILAGSNGTRTNRDQLYIRQPTAAVNTPVQPVVTWRKTVNRPVRSIATDPFDWRRIFVLDDLGRVWFTADGANNPATASGAGAWQWKQLTNNLPQLPGARNFQKIAVFSPSSFSIPTILLGGEGGVFRRIGFSGNELWSEYGDGLPNALVSDIDYIPAPVDKLLVGTLGRGAWTISNASATLGTASSLTLTGTSGVDHIKLERDSGQPWLLNVFQAAGSSDPLFPTQTVPLASLQTITINAGAGNDVITVSSRNGPISVPGGITINGEADTDSLIMRTADGTSAPKHSSNTGSVSGSSGNSRISGLDTFGDNTTQQVSWSSIETPPDGVVALGPAVDAIGTGLASAGDAMQHGLPDVLRGPATALLDPQSLLAGLNGRTSAAANAREDAGDEGEEAEDAPPSSLAQDQSDNSILRRLIEDGLGGFDLAEISSDGLFSDPASLLLALDGLDGIPNNVTLDTSDSPTDSDNLPDTRFDLHISKQIGGAVDLDVAAAVLGGLASVDLTGEVEIEAQVDLHIIFGVDANGFFLMPSAAGDPALRLSDFHVDGSVSGSGRLGLLGVDFEDASLSVDPDVHIDFNLLDPGTDPADTAIRIAEMTPSDFHSLFSVDVHGDPSDGAGSPDVVLNAGFDVSAIFPGVDAGLDLLAGDVTLTWVNLNDPTSATITATPGSPGARFLDFLKMSANQVMGQFQQFAGRMGNLVQSAAMNFSLPFAPTKKLGDLVNLGQAFTDQVISPLEGALGSGTPGFSTIQELAAAIAGPLGIDLGIDADAQDLRAAFTTATIDSILSYSNTGELDIHVPLHRDFTLAVPIDLGSTAGGLGLDFDPITLNVTAGLDMDLTFGFTLTDPNPIQTFAIRVDQLSADLGLQATGIGLHGKVGLLDTTIQNGGIELDGTVTINLTDPTPGDPLSLSDLQTIVSQASQFTRTTLSTTLLAGTGSMSAMLGSSSSFGVSVQQARFGLAFVSTFDTGVATQAPAAYALNLSGNASLLGLGSTMSLSGSALVRINTTGNAVNFTNLAGSGVDLVFSAGEGNTQQATVTGDLTVSGFVSLSGSFAVGLGASSDIQAKLVGSGTTVPVGALSIGASNIHGFAGTGGPFWRDSNGDGVIDGSDTPASAGAAGIAFSNASFALALLTPTNASDTHRYYALKASAGSLQLVGMSGINMSASNISVGINGAFDIAAPTSSPPALNLSLTPITVPTGAGNLVLDFNAGLFSVASDVTFTLGPVSLAGSIAGTVSNGQSSFAFNNLTGSVDNFVQIAATGGVLNFQPASANLPFMTLASAAVSFAALGDDINFSGTNLVLARDGTFTLGSASVSGSNLLNRFGIGGFLPFDINSVTVSGIGGQPITLSRFQLNLGGTFDKSVFTNDLANPVINIGGVSPTTGGAFTFTTQIQNGAVSFPSLNGDVTLGFTGLHVGAMTASATLTLGSFSAGVYTLGTIGASGSLRVDANTSFSFSGKGKLTFPSGGARLELSPVAGDPTFGLKFDADFDTGPGGLARLHVEDFHADIDLAIQFDSQLHLTNSHVQFLNGSARQVLVRLGQTGNEILLFKADSTIPNGQAITINLSNPSQPFITFSSMTVSLPKLQQLLLDKNNAPITGTVQNFAIGQDFSFQPLPGDNPNQRFGVIFNNLPTAQALGLPDWFPLQVTGLGLEFGPGALQGTSLNYIVDISGGLVSTPQFPIDANVQGLKVNLGTLANLFNPAIPLQQQNLLGAIESIDGAEIGVAPIEIGDTLKIGGKLGLRLIDFHSQKALIGTISGFFEMSGIGGGAEVTISQVGPVIGKLDVPLGIPLGPTGLLLEGVSGGFRFGGPAFGEQLPPNIDLSAPPGTIARALLGDSTTFDPLGVSDSQIDDEVRRLLDIRSTDPNFFTWNEPFTMALKGTISTIATPGILSGNLNLAARVDPTALAHGQSPKIQFLGSGDADIFGIQLGAVGALLDLTDPLNPTYNFAFAVPSPNNPLSFLFPAQSTFEVSIDTDGMIEAPLLGLQQFLTNAGNATVSSTLDLLLNEVADRVRTDRDNANTLINQEHLNSPLLDLLSRPLSRLLLAGVPNAATVTIDAAFIRSKLLAALPVSLSALNAMPQTTVDHVANLTSALVQEIYSAGVDLFTSASNGQLTIDPHWIDFASALLQKLGDAASSALTQAWSRFNPVFFAQGVIQPVVLGMPWGDPQQGSFSITKNGFSVQYATSISKMIQQLADHTIPFGGAIEQMLQLGIADQLNVSFGVNGFDALFRSIAGGAGFPTLDPELDFSASFTGSLTFLGFTLAQISGVAVSPGSALLNFPTGSADRNGTFQKVFLLPDGVSPDPGLIPLQLEKDFTNLRDLGGMVLTGQLFAPEMLTDPAGLIRRMINEGDFNPPSDPLKLPQYLDTILHGPDGHGGLLNDKEMARIQTYIPSFGSIFNVVTDNLGRTTLAKIPGDISAQVQKLMDASYLRGFLTDQILSIPLGRASIEASTAGLKVQAQLPWAAGLTAALNIGKVPVNFNSLVHDIAAAAGINVNLSGIPIQNIPVPVASASLTVDAQKVGAIFQQMLGLPPTIFTQAGNLTGDMSLFSPGFVSNIPAIGQNGGIHLGAKLDIRNFVSGADAQFNLPLFSGGAVAPNFSASLDIQHLAIPGFGAIPGGIFDASFNSTLTKHNSVLAMDLHGTASLLSLLDLNVNGNLTIDTSINHPGLLGQFSAGAHSVSNDFFSLDGDFTLLINTTSIAQGSIPKGPVIRVHADGTLTVLGIVAVDGTFDLGPSDEGLSLAGDVNLDVHFGPIDISQKVDIDVTLRKDGRVEGTFDGLGVHATLDRFGCFGASLRDDNGNLTPLPDLPLVPGACDQHVYVDPQQFNETDADRSRSIRIHLTLPAEAKMKVHYIITNGTAQSPGDFSGTLSDTVTIPKGATHFDIPITIKGDQIEEGNEAFHIEITSAEYTDFTFVPIASHISADWNANLTIVDDDRPENPPPVLIDVQAGSNATGSIQTDAGGRIIFKGALNEGAIGTIKLVPQNLDSQDSVQIRYSVVPLAPSLFTTDPANDFAVSEGVVTLTGSDPQEITIATIQDSRYELNEEFELQFEIVREARLAPSTSMAALNARVAITNDDQDQPPGAKVFFDFDDFSGGQHYTAQPKYVDPLLVVSDFRHSSESPTVAGANVGNSSLRFNGGVDHVIASASATNALPTGPFTIDFWINPTSATTRGTILALGGGALTLQLENGSINYILKNTLNATFTGPITTVTVGVWQHVTIVYNGSAATGTSGGSFVIGYLNGARKNSGAAGGAAAYAGQTLNLGTNIKFQDPFAGRLDEMRVWTTALSDAQVAALPALNTAGTESNLLIDYRFDDATGTTVSNSTLKEWTGRLGSTLGIFGPFGRPDWADASDSPVAQFSRYNGITRTKGGVPKVAPVSPTAAASFAPTNTGWATKGTPIAQAPYYTFTVGRDAPGITIGTSLFTSMLALRIDGVDFFNKADATGPTRWELRSSHDGFASALAQGTSVPGADFDHPRVIFSKPLRGIHPNENIEFRLYGLDAAGNGAWTIDNFALIMTTEQPALFNLGPTRPPLVISIPSGTTSAGFNPLNGATDPNGDPITVVASSAPSGTLTSSNGVFFYTPPAGASADIPLSFTLADQWGATFKTTVTAHITGRTVDDSFKTLEDTAIAGNVLSNDKLPAGQTVTVTPIGTLPSSVTLSPSGAFKFTPPLNSTATVSFKYQATGPDWTDVSTVTISIIPVNDLPTAVDRLFTTNEDTTLTVIAPGVLSGITDPDGDPITAVLISGTSKGSLTFDPGGKFVYVPQKNDDTSDSFTYAVSDGTGLSNVATVTIDLIPVNDPPVAIDDSFTVDAGATLSVAAPGVLKNDSDVETPLTSLKAILTTNVSHGTLTLNSNGSFTYTPTKGYSGPDGFKYHATDGGANSADASVLITVKDPNLPPVAVDDSRPAVSESTTTTKTTTTFTIANILANDSDPEAGPLTVTSLGPPSTGTISLSGALSSSTTVITYTAPDANFNGTVTIPYTIADNKGATDTANVIITITPTNDPPTTANDSYSLNVDLQGNQLRTFNPGFPAGVLNNDSDIDGDALTAVLVSNPTHGSLSFSSNGSFTYNFDGSSFRGTDSFTYRARDAAGASGNLASVNITISGLGGTTGATGAIGGYVSYGRLGFDANDNHIWDFNDLNGNGVRDVGEPAEPVADMNRAGNANLFVPPTADLNGDGQITAMDGALLAFNGTISATLQPLSVPFFAPPGSAVITPHTSVMLTLMIEQGFSAAQAQSAVRNAFGLADLDLTTTDPIALASVGSAGSTQYLIGHVQLHDTYAQATSWLVALTGAAVPSAAGQFMSVLAQRIATDPTPLDLTDPAQVAGLLATAATRFGKTVSSDDLNSLGGVIAAANQVLASQSPGADGASAFLQSVYRVEFAAQGSVMTDLSLFGAGALSASSLLTANTGAALQNLIASVKLGSIAALPADGPKLRNLLATATTEGGFTRLSGNIDGITSNSAISLRINWGDGSVEDVSLAPGATSFSRDHAFVDESPRRVARDVRKIGIMLSVNAAPADINSAPVTIDNVAPTFSRTFVTPLIVAGGTATLSGAFFDPGITDAFTLDIDWGDGKTSHNAMAAGAQAVSGKHVYSQSGHYLVNMTLTDEDGGTTTQALAVDVVPPVAPAVTQFIVDDGSAQRSMVRSFTIVFNQPVNLLTGAMSLIRDGNTSYGISASNPSGDERTWVLGFFGPDTVGSSLPDGNYQLNIPAAAVTSALGQNLATAYTAQFYRYFGDIDGDRDVDSKDHERFKTAFGSAQFSPKYVSAFDFNNDGVIDKPDRKEFQDRMGHALKAPASAPAPMRGATRIATAAIPSRAPSAQFFSTMAILDPSDPAHLVEMEWPYLL